MDFNKKLEWIIKDSAVGKAAMAKWFPRGHSLQQFDEIANNRFIRLQNKILTLIKSELLGREDIILNAIKDSEEFQVLARVYPKAITKILTDFYTEIKKMIGERL